MDLSGIYMGKVLHNADPKRVDGIFCRIINFHDMSDQSDENGTWVNDGIGRDGVSGNAPPPMRDGKHVYVIIMFINNDPKRAFYFGEVKYNVEV